MNYALFMHNESNIYSRIALNLSKTRFNFRYESAPVPYEIDVQRRREPLLRNEFLLNQHPLLVKVEVKRRKVVAQLIEMNQVLNSAG